jgi:hypothetical protein
MSTKKRPRSDLSYASACETLHSVLGGDFRERFLDTLEPETDPDRACSLLRAAMRSHVLGELHLNRIVQSFDQRTRRTGLHVLESWNYREHRFADEIIPVLMLDRCDLSAIAPEARRNALSVLLDFYFFTVLGLIIARAWDDGDPSANISQANGLLDLLHGPKGSGVRLVENAETLLLVAISHYHPEEEAYDTLNYHIEQLTDDHVLRLSLACAPALGSHLRWGLRFMYKRDVGQMRADNVVDYPWLVLSMHRLMRELESAGESAPWPLVCAFLNGFTADPWFVAGKAPEWLYSHRKEHAEVRAFVHGHRERLLHLFEPHIPSSKTYSPLGFDNNFLCNTAVAMVATALGNPESRFTLNALFTPRERNADASITAESYARSLMTYARANGGSPTGAALIMYDPYEAAHAFNVASTVLRDQPRA